LGARPQFDEMLAILDPAQGRGVLPGHLEKLLAELGRSSEFG